jgi:hypothetical protein
VAGQEFDHVAVKSCRLLNLAGVAYTVKDLQFAAGDLFPQCRSGPMGVVPTAADDNGWTGDLGVMVFRLWLLIGLKLSDCGIDIAELITFGEHVGKEMRHWRGAKGGAEIFECVAPAVADTLLPICIYAWWNSFFGL